MFLTTGRALEARQDELPVEELRCRVCGMVFDHVDSSSVGRPEGPVTTIGARSLQGAPEQYGGRPRQ